MRTVEKPWGKEEIWGETDKYLGVSYINAGEMLSRQYHEVKEEKLSVCLKASCVWRLADQKRQGSKECSSE